MQSLLLRNLKLTMPTALLFGILGYGVSVPMSFLLDAEAASWRLHIPPQGSIETQRLRNIGQFEAGMILGSTVVGVVVAQVTFVVHTVRSKDI